MNEVKYYKVLNSNLIKIVFEKEYDALSSINKGLMCVFFVFLNVGRAKCRGPPFINLVLKIQIDRRKKYGNNA